MSLAMQARVMICFVLMFGFVVNGTGTTVSAQSAAPPQLRSAVSSAIAPASIVVTGDRFSPGGLVYIALYDGWGTTLHETRWVTANPTVHGPNGSQDPAHGFITGGHITESFEVVRQSVYGANGSQDPAQGYVVGDEGTQAPISACDAPLMVRAFDGRTASWSNSLDVDLGC